jgi:hypothetical protein
LAVDCNITSNGYSLPLRALADSGANGFLFLNASIAYNFAKFLSLTIEELPQPIRIRPYNGKTTDEIHYFLRMGMTIDGRRLHNVPFLILDLGHQDQCGQ